MKLTIEIKMDNAAFEPENGTEAARILRRLANMIDGAALKPGMVSMPADGNGNRVGKAVVS